MFPTGDVKRIKRSTPKSFKVMFGAYSLTAPGRDNRLSLGAYGEYKGTCSREGCFDCLVFAIVKFVGNKDSNHASPNRRSEPKSLGSEI